ncbi:unnamed protein product [Mytilus coruscus]|uniref:Tyr recombinase domain-containing protein n=1 Tax=Mytilus coruscus TaxID=42192 RepID=A0A6J8DCK5_MYTCO|nr:unnamed protein product [Mytilus coruscus]
MRLSSAALEDTDWWCVNISNSSAPVQKGSPSITLTTDASLVGWGAECVVACATIARWIKTVLKLAGIDADMFKAHSTRAASTSAAFLAGMPIKDILKAAGWSNESVFGRFYQKKIAPSTYLGDTILQ